MNAPYRVFFSHGSEDTYVVEHFLKPKVEAAGAEVFLDAGKIEYGDDFRAMILMELGNCDELLVLITKSSLLRPWVIAEIGATLIRDKRIVAVQYGPSESELQELGVSSLLGTKALLKLDEFDDYLSQLKERVEENSYE